MTIKTKDFAFKVTKAAADAPAGSIEGYASVFGNRDSYNEVVMPGAFAESLAKHQREGTYPLMLWQHRSDEPIGVWDDMHDDGKGLYCKGQLLVGQNVPTADKVYSLLKAGAVRGMSIGYNEIDIEPGTNGDPTKLIKLDLMENSIVSFPANRRAGVEVVKSEQSWGKLEQLARMLRDGEPLPTKEFENILREAGVPKSMAVQIASVGYAKAIRSDSGGEDEAKTHVLARLTAAAQAFSR
jgi:HK97 family phage prohead protease